MPKICFIALALMCLVAISACGKRGPIEPYDHGNYQKYTYPAE